MTSGTVDAAKRLWARLKAEKRVSVEDAKAQALSEGVPEEDVRFVLLHGQAKAKKWWTREGDDLVYNDIPIRPAAPRKNVKRPVVVAAVSGDSSGGEEKPETLDVDDIAALDNPREQFQHMALQMNIAEKSARAVATYVSTVADFYNPQEVWYALSKFPEIGYTLRQRLWDSWVSFTRVDVPEQLREAVLQSRPWDTRIGPYRAGGPSYSGGPPRAPARFMAVYGEVVRIPNESEDEGFTFTQAYQLAQTQRAEATERQGMTSSSQRSENESFLAVAYREMAATERFKMEMETARKGSGAGEVEARIESERRSFEMRMDAERKAFEARMESRDKETDLRLEMMQQAHTHQLEMLTQSQAHERDLMNRILDSFQSAPKNPFAALNDVLPGLGDTIATNLMHPPKAPALMPDGMPVEVWERREERENKREMISVFREAVPKLFETFGDLAEATRRTAASRGDALVDESKAGLPPEKALTSEKAYAYCRNPNCETRPLFSYRANADAFMCPVCRAVQTISGEVLGFEPVSEVPQVASSEQQKAETLQAEVSEEEGRGEAAVEAAVEAQPVASGG